MAVNDALIEMWHQLDVPDGLHVELLDGELVMQADPGHIHDLPGRSLVRHIPEPFEAWTARGLLVADDYRPRADAVVIRGEDRPAADAGADWPAQIALAVVETGKGIFGQPIALPAPLGFTVQTRSWRPYPVDKAR